MEDWVAALSIADNEVPLPDGPPPKLAPVTPVLGPGYLGLDLLTSGELGADLDATSRRIGPGGGRELGGTPFELEWEVTDRLAGGRESLDGAVLGVEVGRRRFDVLVS